MVLLTRWCRRRVVYTVQKGIVRTAIPFEGTPKPLAGTGGDLVVEEGEEINKEMGRKMRAYRRMKLLRLLRLLLPVLLSQVEDHGIMEMQGSEYSQK